MCGRAYHTYTDEELELRYLSEKGKCNPLAGLKPNFNLAPTQKSPIVRVHDGDMQLELFRWGLIPFWAKDVKSVSKYNLINARSEEIAEKRSYAQAYRKRRCLVPLSGFVEWKRDGETKRPFAIYLKDQSIMSVAGVWEEWTDPEKNEKVYSFALITTSANGFMEKIHDRMPVILDRKDEETWLDPELQDTTKLGKLLKPCPSTWLAAHEISTLINSPRNNRKEVLEPISDQGDSRGYS